MTGIKLELFGSYPETKEIINLRAADMVGMGMYCGLPPDSSFELLMGARYGESTDSKPKLKGKNLKPIDSISDHLIAIRGYFHQKGIYCGGECCIFKDEFDNSENYFDGWNHGLNINWLNANDAVPNRMEVLEYDHEIIIVKKEQLETIDYLLLIRDYYIDERNVCSGGECCVNRDEYENLWYAPAYPGGLVYGLKITWFCDGQEIPKGFETINYKNQEIIVKI